VDVNTLPFSPACAGAICAPFLAAVLHFTPFGSTPLVAAAQADVEIARLEAEVARAEDLHRRSDYRGAEAILNTLRAADRLTPALRARVLLRLASAQVELGRYDVALRTADEGEPHARTAGSGELLVRFEIARGSAWRLQGFPYRGVSHYERALALSEDQRRVDLQDEVMRLLASTHQLLGNWSRVLDYSERAFERNPNPSDDSRFWYLTNRGIAYYEFLDRGRAEHSFREALEVARQSGQRRSESVALGELGLVAWEFDRNRDRALEFYGQAAAIANEIGVGMLEATWLNNAGNVFRDSREFEAALGYYRRALDAAASGGRGRNPIPLKNIGQVLLALGHSRDAEPLLLEAMAEADRRDAIKIRWQARMELGTLFSDIDASRADTYFAESLELLEAVQTGVLLESFRIGVLGRALSQYDPYDRYITFLLRRGEHAEAFAIAERARARVFLESLTAVRGELALRVPADYLEAETEQLRRISAHQRQLREAGLSREDRRALTTGIDAAEQRLDALRLRLAADQPSLAEMRFPRIWTPDELRDQVLEADETIVTFFLGAERSSAWIVNRNGTEIVRLPARHEIEAAVARLLPTLQSPEAAVDEDARTWLSDALAAPLVARVPEGAHLIVVPHATLAYVPFEVLGDGRGSYLIERYSISYAPSVSSLAYLRQREIRRATPPAIVAIGSPVSFERDRAPERTAPLERIRFLKPLPYSRTELRRIASIFRPHATVLIGDAATEAALNDAPLRNAAILHFATHALVDEEHPDRSALALSARAGDADGILQTREIYRLGLQATLVTLSACQTALGREVTGEGMVGMSRAFFHAGANAVAASLWNVSDRSTADLMGAFYERVREGDSIDRALADAKRRFLQRSQPQRHPYYWAPFIVMGHARVALSFPESPRVTALPWLAIGTAATLAAAAIIARWRRRTSAPARG
jgi:CHAT domain-containing protein/tetratricopeptide (TPR) repeat protein